MEKLSALGELASGVAHDFNNTLAGILGRAQLILRTNDPEKITRGLNIIIKTAEDGAKTVKRIQDFARQRRDHDFEPVSIDQILFDVSEITRPRWKDRAEASNVQISLDLQIRSKTRVMGDESELREVLVNMVFNAVDAMPEGGQLTLAAEDVDDSVVISVGDTGTGMPADVKSRIFDPFFTTKGKAGMGLGLAVSFGIIRRHEGSVEVESEVGIGTRFRIKLPKAKVIEETYAGYCRSRSVIEAPVAKAVRTYDENQVKILVVDDEESVRELLRDLLEQEGCRVYLAPGAREALSLFEVHQFDGIFTDVGMPGMSGWELAHVIRQRNETIPIAVITGWGEAVGSDEQKAARVDWVVTKPFRAERISGISNGHRTTSCCRSKASCLFNCCGVITKLHPFTIFQSLTSVCTIFYFPLLFLRVLSLEQVSPIFDRPFYALLDGIQTERFQQEVECPKADKTLCVFLITDTGNDYHWSVWKLLTHMSQ